MLDQKIESSLSKNTAFMHILRTTQCHYAWPENWTFASVYTTNEVLKLLISHILFKQIWSKPNKTPFTPNKRIEFLLMSTKCRQLKVHLAALRMQIEIVQRHLRAGNLIMKDLTRLENL